MTIPMAELEIDDVAFLTGESVGHQKQSSCGGRSRGICGGGCSSRRCSKGPAGHGTFVACESCSQTQAFVAGSLAISLIILVALIFAFLHPFRSQCFTSGLLNGSSSTSAMKDTSDSHAPLLSTTGEPFPWSDIRLPTFIEPLKYNLFMHPNLTTFFNKGSVDITLRVHQPVNYLVLHAHKLNITEVLMTDDKDKSIPVVQWLVQEHLEQLFVKLGRNFEPAAKYTLKISWNKSMEEQLEGFYVSSYIEPSTERRRYLATTHFEPTFARSAFPCLDEPAMKAAFTLTLVHEQQHEVYFNSERREKLNYNPSGLMMSVFDETVKMSTYLVAFVVCDFKSMSARTRQGVHVRVLVPSEQYNQAEFALETATAILSFYENFFNLTYPLSKLDLVAVPDFGAGAMENWGLITFRTTTILYNPQESSNEAKEQVAVVISHELAHQWFGNLVTMEWWSDLWLNEGFSSFVENIGVNFVYPDWKMLDTFVLQTTQDALSLDSLQASHPIMAKVTNPNEIEAIFDSISYKKGASLIYMLENFLNMDVLRRGLTNYLQKFQFKNAQTRDFWRSLTEVLPKNSLNVTQVMETWIGQKGFPVISSRYSNYQLHLSQRRFLAIEPVVTDTVEEEDDLSPFDYQWIVPISIISNRKPRNPRLVWLNSSSSSVQVDSVMQWYKLNVNQSGFYRVNYDINNWKALTELLFASNYNRHVLSATDRANLMDDAMTLMRVGQLQVGVALNLSAYLENNERDYVVWETALNHFHILDQLMLKNPLLERYLVRLCQPMMTVLGWEDEGSHLMRKLRSSLLSAVIEYGDEQSIRIARRFFDEWIKSGIRIAANLREVVYKAGVQFGTEREWNFCWSKYKTSSVPSEQRLLLSALGATTNPSLLLQYLNFSLDKTQIKAQDTTHVISVVARNPVGRLLVWRFVRENWPIIISVFGQGSFSMDSIISETTAGFTSQFDYREVDDFFRKVDVGSGAQALRQSLERIRANINFKNSVEPQLLEWLRSQSRH